MGFTRARRYANHKSGKKYEKDGTQRQQEPDWKSSEKAQSAAIFYDYYQKAKSDPHYLKLRESHIQSTKDIL